MLSLLAFPRGRVQRLQRQALSTTFPHLGGDAVRLIDDGDENIDDDKRSGEAKKEVEKWAKYFVEVAQLVVERST